MVMMIGCATAKPEPSTLSPEGNTSASGLMQPDPVAPVPMWVRVICVAGLVGLSVATGGRVNAGDWVCR